MNTIKNFEEKNKKWKNYAVGGLYLSAAYFLMIFLNLPVGDYNHFFGFVALWTSLLWFVERFKWKKDPEYKTLAKPKWLEWSVDIFPFVLVFFLLRGFIYEPFKIPSGSMEPTLYTNDIVLVNKFKYALKSPVSSDILIKRQDVKRGDIIVFKYPPNPHVYYIKRAIGLPGDTLEYRFQDKKLLINNQEITRTMIKKDGNLEYYKENLLGFSHDIQLAAPNSEINIPTFEGFLNKESCKFSVQKMTCVLPQGYYFGMGDNRDNSLDSRFWGFIPEANITGTPDLSFNIFKLSAQTF